MQTYFLLIFLYLINLIDPLSIIKGVKIANSAKKTRSVDYAHINLKIFNNSAKYIFLIDSRNSGW